MIKTKVLIVGSGGYLGSALFLYLNKNSDFDVAEFKAKNRIPDDVEMIDIISNYDVIIHVAGGGGNNYCLKEPYKAYRDMIMFTENLIRNSISQQVPKIIFTSSMYVYDLNSNLNLLSNIDLKDLPRSHYHHLNLLQNPDTHLNRDQLSD